LSRNSGDTWKGCDDGSRLEIRAMSVSPASLERPYLFFAGDEPPDVARPTGAWTDRGDCVARLSASADALIAWAQRVRDA
jgi:hypothetical protein